MLDRMQRRRRRRASTTSQLRDAGGELRYEECFTRDGFDGPYTILYHLSRPHTQRRSRRPSTAGSCPAAATRARPLAQAPLPIAGAAAAGRPADRRARAAAVQRRRRHLGRRIPTRPDPVYFANGDGDDLFFIHEGGGMLRSRARRRRVRAGRLRVRAPRACCTASCPTIAPQVLAVDRVRGRLRLPQQWRNEVGQLRMDAPYCAPRLPAARSSRGPRDEGIRDLVVKRGGALPRLPLSTHSPLDVVGWDGTVYPWAFPILNFQPRVGLVHLPPTWHGTFAARGALICSFVPRPVDFHPDAIPCPYPHASVDCDEIIFYCERQLHVAQGRRPGQHLAPPAGRPARPAPRRLRGQHRRDAHRRARGHARHDPRPCSATDAARSVEDPEYHASFE